MIKKSHRKAFDENCLRKVDEQKAERKLKTILNLLNKCISHCISIPNGDYVCYHCKAKNFIELISTSSYNDFKLAVCHICGGEGCVDFVTNAMREDPKEYSMILYSIPYNLLALPNLEVASNIFYEIYLDYFLPEDNTNFSFDNNNGDKTVTEFIKYFIPYKKGCDNSTNKNFVKLESNLIHLVKA